MAKDGSARVLRRLPEILSLALAAFLLFFNLGSNSLHTWDEAGHALVAREILDTGDWLTLHIDGQTYFKKTPLKFWVSAITFKALGVNEWTVRLGSTLFAFATIVALMFLGNRLFGRHVGTLASVILITSHQYLYKHCARTGDIDSYFIFFWTAALLLLLLALQRSSRWLLFLSFAAVGGCGLAKHLALIPQALAVIGLYLLISGAWRAFSWRTWLWALLVPFAVVFPWTAHQLTVHGSAFLDVHLGREIVTRAAEGLPGTRGSALGAWFYFDTLKNGLFPWVLMLPFALVFCTLGVDRETRQKNLLLLVWIALVFLIPSFSIAKAYRYVLPAYPAIALLIAQMIDPSLKGSSSGLARAGLLTALGIGLVSSTTAASHNPFNIQERELMLAVDLFGRLTADPRTWWLALAAGLSILVLFLWRHQRFAPQVAFLLVSLLAVYQVVVPLRLSEHKHGLHRTVLAAQELQARGEWIWTALSSRYTDPAPFRFYLRQLEPQVIHQKPNPPMISKKVQRGGRPVVLLTSRRMSQALSRRQQESASLEVEMLESNARFVLLEVRPAGDRPDQSR